MPDSFYTAVAALFGLVTAIVQLLHHFRHRVPKRKAVNDLVRRRRNGR